MGNADKLLVKMKNNPLNWRIDDVRVVARKYGLVEHRPGKGGSHATFRAANGEKLTVPDHRPIKPVYIKLLLKLIEELAHND